MKMIYIILILMALVLTVIVRAEWIYVDNGIWFNNETLQFCDEDVEECPYGEETKEYTPSTDRICKDGTCNLILWSGVRNANENGTRVENAKSLKNCQFCDLINLDIDLDERFNISIGDYNYTHFEDFCFSSNLTGQIPLKVYRYDDEGNQVNEVNIVIPNSIPNKKRCFNFTLLKPIFGYTVEWGWNSTELILQDADTENLDDATISNYPGEGDKEKGGDDELFLSAQAIRPEEFLIKFDITQVPANQIIDEAYLSVNVNSNTIDAGESFNGNTHHVYPPLIYNISEQEWTEGTGSAWNTAVAPELCWKWRPNNDSGLDQHNTTSESSVLFSQGDTGRFFWSVSNMVSKAYNDGDSNITIWVKGVTVSGSPTSLDDLDIDSKEESTTSVRPYLNITYSEAPPPPDTTSPSYTENGTNTTSPSNNEHILIHVNWTDETMLNYTWCGNNFTGTWINESIVARAGLTSVNHTNVTYITAGGSKDICYQCYANDTSSNVNETLETCLTTAAEDTCSCLSPAATWNVDCSDDCEITENCNIEEYDLLIDGAGTFTISADITAETIAIDDNCEYILDDTKELRIKD